MPYDPSTPWGYEQEQVDAAGIPVAAVPPPAAVAPEGTVEIPLDAWKRGPAGPVPLGGQGIFMAGRGAQFKPEMMAPWTPAVEAERAQLAEQRRLEGIMAAAPVGQENAALERAVRLEGVLAFQSAIKSGVPVMQALQTYGPKMYYNSPGAAAALTRLQQSQFTPRAMTVEGQKLFQVGPSEWRFPPTATATGAVQPESVQAVPLMVGGEQHGYVTVGPRGGIQRLDPDVTPNDQIALARIQLEAIDKDIAAAKFTLRPDAAEIQRLQNERRGILSSLNRLRAGAESGPRAPTSKTVTKQEARTDANQLIAKYPAKAQAIRQRFRERFGEDL